MKGILVKEKDGLQVCKFYTNLPIPEPNDDQIQIRVHAAGVNSFDCYKRSGSTEFPYTPGIDSAGVITKMGKNVKNLKIGDRVFTANSDSGTYAEYTLSKFGFTFKLDDHFNFEEGSAIGVPYFTAYRALFLKGNAKPGQTVLIRGAAGAIGLAAIQLGVAQGLKVIGTTGTQSEIDLVKSYGADVVLNHRDSDYLAHMKRLCPSGVDLVIEVLVNANLNSDINVLKAKKGKIAIIGNRGKTEFNPSFLIDKEISIVGVTLYTSDAEELNLMYNRLNWLFKLKTIKPVIGHSYKLEEAAKAQNNLFKNNETIGRITLTID